MRARLVSIGFLVLLVGALGFIPATLAYTFLAGDRATAQVTACRHTKKTSCTGHWRDAGGSTGSGHISGVGPKDIGRTVEVRIGPLGPYAGGLAGSWPKFLTALPLLLAPPLMVVLRKRITGPGHALAHELLAAPPGDATLMFVGLAKATGLDGRPLLSMRRTDAPAWYQPADLLRKRPRQRPRSVMTLAAGLERTANEFTAVTGPDGEPAFMLERRSSRGYEPETWLLDPGWAARAVVRRITYFPAAFELLAADGERLGRIGPPAKMPSGAFEALDVNGRRLAVMAAYGRRWVLRVEPDTPPLARELTLAFLFDSARLQM